MLITIAIAVAKSALLVFVTVGVAAIVIRGIRRSHANRGDPRWNEHRGQPSYEAPRTAPCHELLSRNGCTGTQTMTINDRVARPATYPGEIDRPVRWSRTSVSLQPNGFEARVRELLQVVRSGIKTRRSVPAATRPDSRRQRGNLGRCQKTIRVRPTRPMPADRRRSTTRQCRFRGSGRATAP